MEKEMAVRNGMNILNWVVGIFLMWCEEDQGTSSMSEERAIGELGLLVQRPASGVGGQSEWEKVGKDRLENWEGGGHGSHIEPRIFNP